jgi:predicted CoA-binding protein
MDEIITHIIKQKHIAVVGVSDKKFGGSIYKTLKSRGYTVYPVHPSRPSFDGDACHAKLSDLPAEVKTAIIAVSPEAAEMVVEDAASAGMTHLWFQQGKDFSHALQRAEEKGLKTVGQKCILMYAQPVTGVHAFHRWLARLFGKL